MAFNIFLCFFLRMRLRHFLINDPMSEEKLADKATPPFHLHIWAQSGSGRSVSCGIVNVDSFGGRLTARHMFLVHRMGVRFLPPEQNFFGKPCISAEEPGLNST